MAVDHKYRLEQFSRIFDLRNEEGVPYLLIGGQAVNYWAERYLREEPLLESFQPFTSEDIDFKGNRADVEHIASQLNLTPSFPSPAAMTALAGSIPFRSGDINSNIEVVRQVPGARKNVDQTAIEIEWNGKRLRVLDPISLLASKLELVATVSQANRQDSRHLRILFLCVRRFLGELLDEVERGGIPPRQWLNIVGYMLKLTATRPSIRIGRSLGLAWRDALPWDAIDASKAPKIVRFNASQRAGHAGTSGRHSTRTQ